jgi:DNA invertase Pin-like site-specific DNA recombinase
LLSRRNGRRPPFPKAKVFATSFNGRENMLYFMTECVAEAISKRNLIRERTTAGLRAARARGRNGGRPRKLKTRDIQAIKALMHAGELPVQDIADRFGVSRATLYRNAAGPESPKAFKTHAIQERSS